MNLFGRLLAKWEAPLILSAWAFAFLYMLDASRFKAFLRPEFGFLVGLGLLLLILMLIAFTQDGTETVVHEDSKSFTRLFRIVAMVFPLLFMLNGAGTQLNVDAFRKRSVGVGSVEREPVLVPASQDAQAQSSGPEMAPAQNILELVVDPRAFDGKHVATIGMVCHDKEIEKTFGTGSFLVFRFAILCCAADARPVSLVVKPKAGFEAKDNKWIRVEGVLSAKEHGKSIVAIIDADSCAPAATPDEPYVYP